MNLWLPRRAIAEKAGGSMHQYCEEALRLRYSPSSGRGEARCLAWILR